MARHLDQLTEAGAPWGACPQVDPQAVLRRVNAALGPSPSERDHPMTKKLRFPIALAAALLLLTGAALAFSLDLRELIAASLGPKAPYATEVLGSCADQGVTIEAQSALTDGRMTQLYFTVQDPTGAFFLEDTDNDLYMDFLAQDQQVWGAGGRGLRQLSYDAETQTGLYVYSQGTYREFNNDQIPVPTHASLSMRYFTPGQRYAALTLFGPADGNCTLPLDRLACTRENDTVVLLPDLNPQSMDADEVAISSMGFGEDGYYHIRLTQEARVVPIYGQCPFDVNYWMADPQDPRGPFDDFTLSDRDLTAVPVPGGWDFRLDFLTEERRDLLQILSVEAAYSVSGGRREGLWSLTVPIQATDSRTLRPTEALVLSRTQDSPPPSGRNDEAQVAQIDISPLGVSVDFITVEGHEYPCSINGEETACALLLADGTTVTPTYYGESWHNRRGWVMWEFDAPIDPEQVVSVTLNGNEVLF